MKAADWIAFSIFMEVLWLWAASSGLRLLVEMEPKVKLKRWKVILGLFLPGAVCLAAALLITHVTKDVTTFFKEHTE